MPCWIKHARPGGAAFAVDREDGEQRGVQRALNVGIFKNRTGDLPPSSIEYFSGRHFFHDIA